MANGFPQLGVVLLGAGASARMGRPKLLLPWHDTTVIGQLLAQWRELGAAQIAIVLRANDADLAAELDRLNFPRADRIENPQPERGMFSSIVCAAHWSGWRREISSWAVVLGDQPHLRPETLELLVASAAQNREAICQPAFGGHTRHPVILPRQAFLELKKTGAATMKDFLNLTTLPRVQCSVADAGLSLDLDTPEDYKRLTISHQPV
ncbi:MAG TPA: nucleotidyltransferase family protein [Verrucomicrobiae bacterium]|nr:nucleotidyltransferase family protein [Verrucomicrobiae bacterium]